MNQGFDVKEFILLGDKIHSGNATNEEKDEYMKLLYQNGKLKWRHYDAYLRNKDDKEMLQAGLAIGGIISLGYLLSELLGDSKLIENQRL